MPKRKYEDKIKHYRRKIRKMEHQQKKYNRIIYSSSEDSENDSGENAIDNVECRLETSDILDPSGQDVALDNDKEIIDGYPNPEPATVPELDSDILTALGESTEETPKFGPNIHEKLSRLWLPILRKGLNKEAKDKLVKEYLIPENCPLLQAPKLNPEISAAVTESTRTRDKRVEAVQQQLGQGISALNKGLELILDDDKNSRLQAIKFLSDGCRLFCDLHFIETEARKKFVTPGLDKSFLNIMQEVDRDEMLFGNKLSEKIKATKVIEKHGLQIKKPQPNNKTPMSYRPPANRRPQENWGGPSRFSSNRGGRGGQRKTGPRGRGAPTGSAAQPKSAAQSKQRATTQQ